MKRLSFLRGALAIAAALLALGTSCTNDDNGIGNPQVATPQAMGRIHVTVGAGMGGDADTQTRSDVITNDAGRTLIFTEGDKLYVRASVTAVNDYIVAGTLSIGDISDDGKTAMFSGDLQVYHYENGAFVESTYAFTDADPLNECKNHEAYLIAKDMPAGAYTIKDYWDLEFDYSKSIAANVETLMKTALKVESYRSYETEKVGDGGPKMFRSFGGEPILSCAVSGLTAGTAYTVSLLVDYDESDWNNYVGNLYSVTYATPVTAGDDGIATFAISFENGLVGWDSWWTLKLVGGGITRYVKLGQKEIYPNKVYRVNREATYAPNTRLLSGLTENLTLADGDVLTGTLDGTMQKVKISIADRATVTLAGATIIGVDDGDDVYKWAGLNCLGNATIILADGTTNSVTNFQRDYPCIHVPEGKTLTIRGGSAGTGKLIANNTYFGAGIGGGYMISCGNIVIEGGDITATGGSGGSAGIGCGYGASCGTIMISGGTVNATGGYGGAGIGCYDENSSCGAITITGGTVNATGGISGAGIGSGSQASCDAITISGGTVNATGGEFGAGIGSGYYNASCGDITISGGTVRAQGGNNAAGIGCGLDTSCGNISISRGTDFVSVTAIKGGGADYPIGLSGFNSTCGKIDIDGSTIKDSGNGGYDIGSDYGSLHVEQKTTPPDGTPEDEQGQYNNNTWVLTPL